MSATRAKATGSRHPENQASRLSLIPPTPLGKGLVTDFFVLGDLRRQPNGSCGQTAHACPVDPLPVRFSYPAGATPADLLRLLILSLVLANVLQVDYLKN